MKFPVRLIPLAAAAAWLVTASPVSAGQGNVNSIKLYDLNHNGKIERAVVTIDNPLLRTWKVNGTSGLKAWYGSTALKVKNVFVTTTSRDELAKLEVVWEEGTELPTDTSASNFEIEYPSTPLGSGIDDGTDVMSPISVGDTSASDTELDAASPLLISSSPAAGTKRIARYQDITLTFSEAVLPNTLTWNSSPDVGSWGQTWTDSKNVKLNHSYYVANTQVSFTVTNAKDETGNILIPGSAYPNPFAFSTASDSPNPVTEPTFKITEPSVGSNLLAGTPVVVGWYNNHPEVASVRLSYTTGGPYITIATFPVAQRSILWTAPYSSLPISLYAEGLTSAGTPFVIDTLSSFIVTNPSEKPKLMTVVPAVATDISDTAATLSVGFDFAPSSIEVYCNGTKRSETISLSYDRPAMASARLTGLKKDALYDCQFRAVDTFANVTNVSVPQVIASSKGDTRPPVLVGAPKFDAFDAATKTVRMTVTTDEPTTMSALYGVAPSLNQTVSDAALATTHIFTLNKDIAAGAKYRVQLSMTDAYGNTASGKEYSFIFLNDGERIKGSSAAVYLYLGGKRLVFANETIYRSWFADFSGVVVIPDEQLASTPIGGNVQLHSGTWMVKISSDPKTYAVEPGGVLRWVQSEAQAKALYGQDWNKRVRDIDVSQFSDYRIGEPLRDGEFPDGYTARTSDGKSWAVLADVHRLEMTASGLAANHYAAASSDAGFLPPADEGTVAWARLLVKEPLTAYDQRLNLVRFAAGGAKVYTP